MNGLIMKYFVLKPEGDDVYAGASRAAIWAYAYAIQKENPDMSKALMDWADSCAKKDGYWSYEQPKDAGRASP